MLRVRLRRVAAFAVPFLLSACSSRGPATISVISLTSEHRSFKSPPFNIGFNEMLSVSGFLLAPDIKIWLAYQGSHDPETAIGIASDRSYRLVLETAKSDADEVFSAAAAVDEILRLTRRTVADAAELEEIEKSRTAGMAESGPLLRERAEFLTRRLWQTRDDLEAAEARLTAQLRKPGVVLARWERSTKGDLTVAAPPFASGEVGAGEVESGFVILGGIRIAGLFFGNDVYWFYKQLTPMERTSVKNTAITTYILQAQHVAYVSAADSGSRIAARSPSAIAASPWRVSVDAAIDRLQQLSNVGTLTGFTWSKEPVRLERFEDLPELDKQMASFQGYGTVFAQATNGGSLFFHWDENGLPPITRNEPEFFEKFYANPPDSPSANVWRGASQPE